jgi:hypothetical protein
MLSRFPATSLAAIRADSPAGEAESARALTIGSAEDWRWRDRMIRRSTSSGLSVVSLTAGDHHGGS